MQLSAEYLWFHCNKSLLHLDAAEGKNPPAEAAGAAVSLPVSGQASKGCVFSSWKFTEPEQTDFKVCFKDSLLKAATKETYCSPNWGAVICTAVLRSFSMEVLCHASFLGDLCAEGGWARCCFSYSLIWM